MNNEFALVEYIKNIAILITHIRHTHRHIYRDRDTDTQTQTHRDTQRDTAPKVRLSPETAPPPQAKASVCELYLSCNITYTCNVGLGLVEHQEHQLLSEGG